MVECGTVRNDVKVVAVKNSARLDLIAHPCLKGDSDKCTGGGLC